MYQLQTPSQMTSKIFWGVPYSGPCTNGWRRQALSTCCQQVGRLLTLWHSQMHAVVMPLLTPFCCTSGQYATRAIEQAVQSNVLMLSPEDHIFFHCPINTTPAHQGACVLLYGIGFSNISRALLTGCMGPARMPASPNTFCQSSNQNVVPVACAEEWQPACTRSQLSQSQPLYSTQRDAVGTASPWDGSS